MVGQTGSGTRSRVRRDRPRVAVLIRRAVAALSPGRLHQMAHVFPALGIEGIAAPAAPVAGAARARPAASVGPPRIRPDVVWMPVESDVVAVDGAGRAHVIDGTGALLWPLLDGSAGADDLAEDVADVFGIDADRARSDVETFLADVVKARTGGPRRTDGTDGWAAAGLPACRAGAAAARPDGTARSGVGRHRRPRHRRASSRVGRRPRRPGRVALRAVRRLAVGEADDVPVDFGLSVDRRGGRGPRLIPVAAVGEGHPAEVALAPQAVPPAQHGARRPRRRGGCEHRRAVGLRRDRARRRRGAGPGEPRRALDRRRAGGRRWGSGNRRGRGDPARSRPPAGRGRARAGRREHAAGRRHHGRTGPLRAALGLLARGSGR